MTGGMRIVSLTGATLAGEPLALSCAPCDELRPWFNWFTIAEAEIAEGHRVNCGRAIEHPSIIFLFHDPWVAGTADGDMVLDPGEAGKAFYFGPQTRRMPLSIAGRYVVVSLWLNAGAAPLLGLPCPMETLDRIIDLDEYFGKDEPLTSIFPEEKDARLWQAALEDKFLRPLTKNATIECPSPLVCEFENACLAEPHITVEEFAARQDVSKRTVERAIKKAFGITPKRALRRGRALDMAAALLGVTRPEDAPEMEDRYFDQSHRVKELKSVFGVSPGQLKGAQHPILQLSLEVRQQRRLDALELLAPDAKRPWRDPESEPPDGSFDEGTKR